MALVANELLAFIQHAIDTMDEVSIMQICKSSFSSEEICKGKQLLYETLGQSANMPSRRRDGTERSVQDIISLLKQTDPDEVPAFVAKELHKLPPVTRDHVDVVSLLKDIRFLKEELAGVRGRLQASESTISDLRIELSQLKSGNSICRSPQSPDAAYVTTRRGAQASAFSPSVSALSDGSTNTAAAASARAPLPVAPTPSPHATKQNFATVAGRPAPPPRAKTNGENESRKASESRKTKESRKATKNRKVESSRPGKDESRRCDEEGFILVERRKKPAARNHRGTAPYVPELRLRSEVPATPLYISRLHWSMEVEDVVDYIQKKTTLRLRVERLQSRHKVNFSSFMVRVPTNLLSTFEAPEFWPMDVVYRRFRGRLRNEASSHVAGNK